VNSGASTCAPTGNIHNSHESRYGVKSLLQVSFELQRRRVGLPKLSGMCSNRNIIVVDSLLLYEITFTRAGHLMEALLQLQHGDLGEQLPKEVD
jgi:hypothetical protein